MARPFIEFIQAQNLTWDARHGVEIKHLSQDDETGASSSIVRYPPGWQTPGRTLASDQEFFVLDGEIRHGNVIYTQDCYAFWPRGFQRQAMVTPTGAVVLMFHAAPDPNAPYDPDRLTEYVNIREGDWNADLVAMGLDAMATFSRIRRLRSDPDTGEITYVTAVLPFFQESQPERHPVIQEIFVLAGEVAGPHGIMRAGAYVWRPANITHGPYGSTTGAVFLFRSHGGPQATEHDPPVPFRFDPPHNTVVPPCLRVLAEPVPPFTRY